MNNLKQHTLQQLVKSNIPIFLILFPLFADILTGFIHLQFGVSLPIGSFTRLLIIVGGFVLVIKTNYKINQLILLIMIFYLSLCSYWLINQQDFDIMINLKVLSSILLPFFIFLILNHFQKFFDQDKLTLSLSLYGLIAAASIVIFYFLNIGYESYGDYAFGFEGVFISGNDIGICLVI